MIAELMLRAVATAAFVGLAAWLAEGAAWPLGSPRRWIWATAIFASIVLPVLALKAATLLPGVPALAALLHRVHASMNLPIRAGASGVSLVGKWSIETVLLSCWIVSSGLALVWFVAVSLWLRKTRASWIEGQVDGMPVLVAPHEGPAVLGWRRPVVVIPRWVLGVPEAQRQLIALHEQSHARAGDAQLLALGVIALVAMPWNPALWWQHRRLRRAIEIDCDARVLATGADVEQYGEVLLATAGRSVSLVASPGFNHQVSLLESRILAMTKKSTSRMTIAAYGLAAAVAVAAACDVATPDQLTAPTATDGSHGMLSAALKTTTPLPTANATTPAGPMVLGLVDGKQMTLTARLSNRGIRIGDGERVIDFQQIKTIDVLKGPAATARYGTKAANGVILVTTKNGQAAASKATAIDVSLSTGDGSETKPAVIGFAP